MELFSLPHTAKVNKVIPKNAFDSYTTAKQKKLLTELISRITWTYKLSPDTVNLEAREIKEIQVFRIELKVKQEIQLILDIIDKSIPYNIIFVVEHDEMIYISTSSKHPSPINEDNSVIDFTFKTDWFNPAENLYTLKLQKSIDAVYQDLCIQLSGKSILAKRPLHELIQFEKNKVLIEKKITKLRNAIAGCKQFNTKVELNQKLKNFELELSNIYRDFETRID